MAENAINKYWVTYVIAQIQSETIVMALTGLALLIYAYFQIRSKKFTIRAYEVLILFFYTKYRFYDSSWNFHPLLSPIKYFDTVPFFVLLPKLLAFLSFYDTFEVNVGKRGIIDPDIPLSPTNPKDELNRNKFAEELVEVLKYTKPSERALVIGINGTWGSGKTSLQYLIEKSLFTKENRELFYVINFNPWFYSHSLSLAQAFLNVVKNKIDDYAISKSISRYAGSVISGTESILLNTSIFSEIRTKPNLDEELEVVKSKIKNLKKSLLVIIDDLDRLGGEELIEVLRLVRLVGDFPNTIYIILYDKEYVKGVINDNLSGHNSSIYIDKIIQVEYSIPESNIDGLKQLLLTHLSNAVEKAIPNSSSYWSLDEMNSAIKLIHFGHFIKHFRDIKRFTNNFLLRYKSIYSEVNFKQFFLLELLRYRHPELTSIIYNSKDIFLTQINLEYQFTNEVASTHDFWTKVVKNENAKSVLVQISEFKKEKRSISELSFFPNYFTLTLQNDFITEGEFADIVSVQLSETTQAKYSAWINNKRDSLLYRFRNHEPLQSIEAFINYVDHLGFVENILINDTGKTYGKSWEELAKIFLNKYSQVKDSASIDSRTLYTETSKYLYVSGQHTCDVLKNIFRSNTSFIVKADFNDSPLAHGWKERENREVSHLNSIFQLESDTIRGNYIIFRAPPEFRFELNFDTAPVFLRNARCEMKTFEKEWQFYIKVNASKGTQYKTLLFRLLDQGVSLGKVDEDQFTVGLIPSNIENEWKRFEIDIEELFKRSYANEGFTLHSVLGIAICGKLAFGTFELY
ncbi:hypothetical protein WSM22_18190 [Cytophagales bacterium WSM2-2]|nr:hypothetical protein WSM22_18190 [Cytophagales bacterium WSM2-2]